MIRINHEKLSEKLSDKIDEILRFRDAQVFETYCDMLVYHNSSWGFWVFFQLAFRFWEVLQPASGAACDVVITSNHRFNII